MRAAEPTNNRKKIMVTFFERSKGDELRWGNGALQFGVCCAHDAASRRRLRLRRHATLNPKPFIVHSIDTRCTVFELHTVCCW